MKPCSERRKFRFPISINPGRLRSGLVFLTLIISETTYAFPEMIREGYASCRACHYQPSGGGPINDYGRTIAGELLSTWGSAREAEAFYGLFNIAPFGIGGDYRYLVHQYDDENVKIDQRFAMQKELSLTFDPSKNVSFVASGGYYGFEPDKYEMRRYFGQVRIGGLSARAGRFLPAFGYEIPDHTKSIKQLFGQGKETLNFELAYAHKVGEVFLTRVAGTDTALKTGDTPTVKQSEQSREGYIAKATFFAMKGLQVGGSYAQLETFEDKQNYTGLHAFWGLKKLYALADYQIHPDDRYKGYAMLGYEAFQGFHIKLEHDSDELENETFGTIDFFPRPHWQFTGSASERQYIFVSHYYL